MDMNDTPQSNRLHIGVFGRCNAGKSTLINMMTGQAVSLVSDVPGTTTDPVRKSMEILPLGPVLIVDTAGVDDESPLGGLRIAKSKEMLPKMNLAIYVLGTDETVSNADVEWLTLLRDHKLPTLLVLNEKNEVRGDVYIGNSHELSEFNMPYVSLNALSDDGKITLLESLGKLRPIDEEGTLLEGIVEASDIVVLVCPIDSAAPKGRLILPQVQMMREILDRRGIGLVVQTEELEQCLTFLGKKPKIVITDSQAFDDVSKIVPKEIQLTSFSILMARFKGRLKNLIQGIEALQSLQPGDKVLISEGCTHHRQCDDIGTVKIPRWLTKAGYEGLHLEWTSGGKFPESVKEYKLIIHCGACMLTRREVLRRLDASVMQGVPMVNYGVLIAFLHGILDRALEPFNHEI